MKFFFTNNSLDPTAHNKMDTMPHIARSHLGIQSRSFQAYALARSVCYSIQFCTTVSHTMLSCFSSIFCNSSHLMSDFITFLRTFWSIHKPRSNNLSVFHKDTTTSSTITGSLFTYHTANIHKILILRNLIWFKMTVIFNGSIFIFHSGFL